MPGLLISSLDRRAFIRTALLGGVAVVAFPGRAGAAGSPGVGSPFHVALLSDTHIPGDRSDVYRGFRPGENLKQIIPDILAVEPEAAVISGDAARLEGKPEDYAELRELLTPLAQVAPVAIGLGNHDNRTHFYQAFTDLAGEQAKVQGKHVTILEHPAVRLVVLDSLLYVNKVAGLLGRGQREWLAETLPGWTDRPVVLMVHHTLGDGDGDLLDADRMFAILREQTQVKAVFYGHSHVWSLGERDGIRLINLPAVGYNFRDSDPVGWVEAWFKPTGARLKLHASAGNRSDDGQQVDLRWRG